MCGIFQCLIFIFFTTNCLAYRCPNIPANIHQTSPNKFLSPNPWRRSFPTFSWRTLHCLPDTGHVSAHWSPWARTACLVYHQYLAVIRWSSLEWMLETLEKWWIEPPALTGTQIQPSTVASSLPLPHFPHPCGLYPPLVGSMLPREKATVAGAWKTRKTTTSSHKMKTQDAVQSPKVIQSCFGTGLDAWNSLFHRCLLPY